MISRKDLEVAVKELVNSPPTYQTCAKLADLYVILDHLDDGYSEKVSHREIRSEFLKATEGKKIDAVMDVMDELMDATQVLSPRLYENVIMRIRDL